MLLWTQGLGGALANGKQAKRIKIRKLFVLRCYNSPAQILSVVFSLHILASLVFRAVVSVCFYTGHFVMVPLNLTCLH